MANVTNPIQVEKFLEGLDYPASKDEIIEHAKNQGADEDILGTLQQLPERDYEGPVGISEEIESMNQ